MNNNNKKFAQTIIAQHGQAGNVWLERLPTYVAQLAQELALTDLRPLQNLSYNYLLLGKQQDQEVVLKLSINEHELNREAAALQIYAGSGAVQLLAQQPGALLLQRALPGTPLSTYFPNHEDVAAEITVSLIQKLHNIPISYEYPFPALTNMLDVLDQDWPIPQEILKKARNLREHLESTTKHVLLLHGDLHQDNMIQHDNQWLIIDPKGIIGDPAYEVAIYLCNPINKMFASSYSPTLIKTLMSRRIKFFAQRLAIEEQRLYDWGLLRAIMGWIWNLQDHLDYSFFKKITSWYIKLKR